MCAWLQHAASQTPPDTPATASVACGMMQQLQQRRPGSAIDTLCIFSFAHFFSAILWPCLARLPANLPASLRLIVVEPGVSCNEDKPEHRSTLEPLLARPGHGSAFLARAGCQRLRPQLTTLRGNQLRPSRRSSWLREPPSAPRGPYRRQSPGLKVSATGATRRRSHGTAFATASPSAHMASVRTPFRVLGATPHSHR
jgi:hypothetical protein